MIKFTSSPEEKYINENKRIFHVKSSPSCVFSSNYISEMNENSSNST